jgi:thiamine pyrophosphate-dependent acetolactate synthase large subunit-like protein
MFEKPLQTEQNTGPGSEQLQTKLADSVELPTDLKQTVPEWESDVIADVIRSLDLRYIALNPGASFRGLHDSFVNYLGNRNPQMLLCLHEEHAVCIAHGYAKVTGRPMGAFLHSNVGLMHGSAGIFNAWCDRVPMMVFGATGMVDAATRRPWIEWIHTSQDQGALVRDFTKWDAQPASVSAAVEALLRAKLIACTAPCGPVYVNLPNDIQEHAVKHVSPTIEVNAYASTEPGLPPIDRVREIANLLCNARRPVILAGRVGRETKAWQERIELAEKLQACVLTDLRVGAAFPTEHPLHAASPVLLFGEKGAKVLREADLVLSLDWLDLGGAIKAAWGHSSPPRIIQISQDIHVHRGWSMDHQSLPKTHAHLLSDPDQFVSSLLPLISVDRRSNKSGKNLSTVEVSKPPSNEPLTVRSLGQVISFMIQEEKATLARLPLGWAADVHGFRDPLSYLGYDGGGAIGSGPGMAIGSALALRDHHPERLPIAVLGDGDFMMGCQAVWTAVRYGIPNLIVVCNNRSFYNDEVHQEQVALARGRPVKNKVIGMHIGGPLIDIAGVARAQGAFGIGPVHTGLELANALKEGIERVRAGEMVVIDAHVEPGYDPAMADAFKHTASSTQEKSQ